MDNQQESLNFVPLPGYPKYFTNLKGDIFSTKRNVKPQQLSPYKHYGHSKNPYYRLKINNSFELSHRVIASTLIGRKLNKDEFVNHIDGNTLNNKMSNIEIVSHRENVNHAVQNNLYCSGKEWYKARGMQGC